MRWLLYTVLALTYALTLGARFERAEWMQKPTIAEHVMLWLSFAGLIALVLLGFRRASGADRHWLLALALGSAIGFLLLTLIPSIQ